MLEQRALHLEWPDAIARRDDDVVGPADEPEVAILVASGAVSGQVPFATPAGCGLLRALPVLAEERRRVAPPRPAAARPAPQRRAVLVDHAQIVAGERLAHRTRADG